MMQLATLLTAARLESAGWSTQCTSTCSCRERSRSIAQLESAGVQVTSQPCFTPIVHPCQQPRALIEDWQMAAAIQQCVPTACVQVVPVGKESGAADTAIVKDIEKLLRQLEQPYSELKPTKFTNAVCIVSNDRGFRDVIHLVK